MARRELIGIAFGHQLERKSEQPVALTPRLADGDRSGSSRSARIARGPWRRMRSACAQRRDRVETLFLQILIELLGWQLDRARVAVITDDEQPGAPTRTRPAGSPPSRPITGFRPAASTTTNCLISADRAESDRPASPADAQPHADDLAGCTDESRRLDPHVMCDQRRDAEQERAVGNGTSTMKRSPYLAG